MRGIIVVLLICIVDLNLYGQVNTTDCSGNGGFENNALLSSDWILKVGPMKCASPNPVWTNNPEYHDNTIIDDPWNTLTVVTSTPLLQIQAWGSDMFVPVLGLTSGSAGSNYSLRIGDLVPNQLGVSISKQYAVNSSNAHLSFRYAIVCGIQLGHGNSNGGFGYRIKEGNIVRDGRFFPAADNSPFYINYTSSVRYKPWSCVSVDLSNYIGKTITIEFYSKDCAWPSGSHVGYAYIDDIQCTPIANCDQEEFLGRPIVSNHCKNICIDYSLPQIATNIGTVELKLIHILDGNSNIISSSGFLSGSTSNMTNYCFSGLPILIEGDLVVQATFTLNGSTWVRNSSNHKLENCKVSCCLEDTIYSSSKYGYNRSLPVMVSNNAKYHEIEFCSFEENNFVLPAASAGAEIQYDGILPNNINFASYPNSTGVCVTDVAHTGKKSLQVLAGNNPSYPVRIAPLDYTDPGLTKDANHNIVIPPRYIEPQFNVLQSKKYKMRLWIKSTSTTTSVNNYVTIQMKKLDGTVLVSNATGSFVTDPIEGWKLYELDLPAVGIDAREMTIQFHGGAEGEIRFFDDIRIIPSEALAKSYVYHEKSLKLISELDENHFATFYDYDEAGNLIRVRKETEKGIVTLKEATVNYQKKR